MTLFKPGPWELEFAYVEAGLTHLMRLNCDMFAEGAVGDPATAFVVNRRAATPTDAVTIGLAWVNLIRTQFAVSTNFTVMNIYKYVPGTLAKVFYSTATIGLTGSVAGIGVSMQQLILTFRSQLGNGVKLNFLEITTPSSVRMPMDDATAGVQAIADFATGVQSWILARDGSYPIGQLNACFGRNDAIERKRFR